MTIGPIIEGQVARFALFLLDQVTLFALATLAHKDAILQLFETNSHLTST